MIIDFSKLRTATVPDLNGGEGAVTAAGRVHWSAHPHHL